MVHPINIIICDMDRTLVNGATYNSFGYSAGVDRAKWDGLKTRYRHDQSCAEEWGRANAQMLKGKRVADIWQEFGNIPYEPGVRRFFSYLDPDVERTGILTSSIDVVAERVCQELGMDFSVSNILGVDDGVITGKYQLKVSMHDKLERFARVLYEEGIPVRNLLYVGDNENDMNIIEFVRLNGGYTAAFNPYKCPELAEAAHFVCTDFVELSNFVKDINDAARAEPGKESKKQMLVEAVGVIIADRHDRIVLIKEARRGGMWNIPGGRVREGEQKIRAVKREAREETGLEIAVTGFVGQYERMGDRGDKILKTNYAAVVDGHPDFYSVTPRNPKEIECAAWFNVRELVDDNPHNVPRYVITQLIDYVRRKPVPTFMIGKVLNKDAAPAPDVIEEAVSEEHVVLQEPLDGCNTDELDAQGQVLVELHPAPTASDVARRLIRGDDDPDDPVTSKGARKRRTHEME